jgi:hypothetical protein
MRHERVSQRPVKLCNFKEATGTRLAGDESISKDPTGQKDGGFHFIESNLMKRENIDSYDTKTVDDSVHEENETVAKGRPFVRKKYGSTIEDETATAVALDQDVLFASEDQDEPEHDAKTLPRIVGPATAKQQIKNRLQEAKKDFTFIEAETPPSIKEETFDDSWHIRDQITRGNLGKDGKIKARLSSTIHRLRSDCYLTTLDPLGVSVHTPGKESSTDFAMQKDSHGKVVYENGQSLDRKKAKSKRADGVIETQYDGSVRKAKRSAVVHEFNVHRDEPLSFSITDAINIIEEIQAGLGPLWPILEPVICDNKMSAEVGYSFGKTDPQASAVGNVILKIALEEAATIYDRIDERDASDLAYVEWLEFQNDALPVPARRLKRALSSRSAGLVFRHNHAGKSGLSAANDNHSRSLAA